MRITERLRRKFWSQVEIGSESECWEWKGVLSQDRFAKFNLSRMTSTSAQRFAMQDYLGKRISKHHYVVRTCENPRCVNPAHLTLSYSPKLTFKRSPSVIKSQTRRAIPVLRSSGFSITEISRALGVKWMKTSRLLRQAA